MSESEKPDECECCQFKTEELVLYEGQYGSYRKPLDCWYCQLCATTMASTMTRYYSQYSTGERQIVQAICYVGNAIIAAIKESKNAP